MSRHTESDVIYSLMSEKSQTGNKSYAPKTLIWHKEKPLHIVVHILLFA